MCKLFNLQKITSKKKIVKKLVDSEFQIWHVTRCQQKTILTNKMKKNKNRHLKLRFGRRLRISIWIRICVSLPSKTRIPWNNNIFEFKFTNARAILRYHSFAPNAINVFMSTIGSPVHVGLVMNVNVVHEFTTIASNRT